MRRQNQSLGHREFVGGLKEFLKRERMHFQKLNTAYGKRNVSQSEIEQRTGCDNMQFRHLFEKVSKGCNCSRTALDLVDKQKVFSSHDPLVQKDLQLRENPRNIQVAFEYAMPVGIPLQIDAVNPTAEAFYAQRFNRPSLAGLTRPPTISGLRRG